MIRNLTKPLLLLTASALVATAAGATLPGAPSLALAAQAGAVIPSDADDALDRPELWHCTRILPEYRAWLEAGNSTSDWKYFGKTFRDESDGELYDWTDWLRWAQESGCSVGPYVESEFAQLLVLPLANSLIGGAITAAGAGGLMASGSNADSPG